MTKLRITRVTRVLRNFFTFGICSKEFSFQFLELTSKEVSPFWIFTDRPAAMASGSFSMKEKRIRRPTAVRTDPSMLPMGGQKKPPTIRRMLTTRVMR